MSQKATTQHEPRIRLLIVSSSLLGAGIQAAARPLGDCHLLRLARVDQPQDLQRIAEAVIEYAQIYRPHITVFDASDTLALFECMDRMPPLSEKVSMGRARLAPLGHLVVLTPAPDEEQGFLFLTWGVTDCIGYGLSPEQFRERLGKVLEGCCLVTEESFTTQHTTKLPSGRTRKEPEGSPLSQREREILIYVARGNSNKEIGRALKISAQTVKNHMTSIHKKLSNDKGQPVKDRTAAVVYALFQGWINPSEITEAPRQEAAAEVADQARVSPDLVAWAFAKDSSAHHLQGSNYWCHRCWQAQTRSQGGNKYVLR